MQKADRIKKMKVKEVAPEHQGRLPAGQVLTERFPILHEGEVPEYEMDTWDFKIFGEIETPITLTYTDILKLPQSTVTSDIHCVTRWSKFDTEFTGVKVKDLFDHYGIKPVGKYVMVYGDHDYETNLPLESMMDDDVLLAHSYDGKPLSKKHGWPLRLVVPKLYFWKSAKWVRSFEFMKEDKSGFWESNGFHNEADPFKEERFSNDDMYLPEDEWEKKDFD